MTIDEQLILKLEKLARLRLENGERERLANDLTKILGMVDKLSELDTEGVEPLRYLTELPAQPREDGVKNQLSRQSALETDGEFFKVPKMK